MAQESPDVDEPVEWLRDPTEPPPIDEGEDDLFARTRVSEHGSFDSVAQLAQRMKHSMRNHMLGVGWEDMTPIMREASDGICHELACIANGDQDEERPWRDIATYARFVEKHLAERNQSLFD
jgi:hypothetical protein